MRVLGAVWRLARTEGGKPLKSRPPRRLFDQKLLPSLPVGPACSGRNRAHQVILTETFLCNRDPAQCIQGIQMCLCALKKDLKFLNNILACSACGPDPRNSSIFKQHVASFPYLHTALQEVVSAASSPTTWLKLSILGIEQEEAVSSHWLKGRWVKKERKGLSSTKSGHLCCGA